MLELVKEANSVALGAGIITAVMRYRYLVHIPFEVHSGQKIW